MVPILAWSSLAILTAVGVAGTILPGIPGVALIALGALIHKLLLPGVLSWWTVAFLFVAIGISWGVDILGSMMGARWGGATRWGLIGAAVGGLVGIVFGLVGLIIGPILGAFLAELVAAGRRVDEAAQAGIGAGIGLGFSTILRFTLAMLCVAVLAVDAFLI